MFLSSESEVTKVNSQLQIGRIEGEQGRVRISNGMGPRLRKAVKTQAWAYQREAFSFTVQVQYY